MNMSASPLDQPLTLTLAPDEAVVLFEFLSRAERDEQVEIQQVAEDVVLTQLLARLEKHLVTPLRADYLDLLAAARDRVTGSAA